MSNNSFVGVFEYMFDMSNDAHPLNLICTCIIRWPLP